MAKIIRGKVGKADFMEALKIAGAKILLEKVTAPFIGNATLGSGIIKGIGAWAVPTLGGNNTWTKLISTALVIDASEDIITGGLQMLLGGNNQTLNNGGW